ncbi:hypothetical protein F4778DRAFT_790696 [Xylariomycetidae sp. FL2044]|nr:hypothetical protein F4778DRAFT_790696 [Xylariomycetidae sp. FL2044]
MQLPPPSVIANWPKPNYIDPETRGPAGVPATAFTIVAVVAETKFGSNKHVWDVRPELFMPGLIVSMVETILFDLATSLTKLSMLAIVYRIDTASKNMRMKTFVLALATVISLNGFLFIIVTIFQCRPVSDYWTLSATPQDCIDEGAHLTAASVINTVTDFIVVLLPIKTVIDLDLPAKQRAIVMGLFGAGLVASSAGIVRTYFTWLMTTTPDHDRTWSVWVVSFSSSIELNLGILCASIPATKPFFADYLPKFIGSSLRSRNSRVIAWDDKPPKSTDSSSSAMSFIHVEDPVSTTTTLALPIQQEIKTIPQQQQQQVITTPTTTTTTPSTTPSTTITMQQKQHLLADLNKPLPPIEKASPSSQILESRYSMTSSTSMIDDDLRDQDEEDAEGKVVSILSPPRTAALRYIGGRSPQGSESDSDSERGEQRMEGEKEMDEEGDGDGDRDRGRGRDTTMFIMYRGDERGGGT